MFLPTNFGVPLDAHGKGLSLLDPDAFDDAIGRKRLDHEARRQPVDSLTMCRVDQHLAASDEIGKHAVRGERD